MNKVILPVLNNKNYTIIMKSARSNISKGIITIIKLMIEGDIFEVTIDRLEKINIVKEILDLQSKLKFHKKKLDDLSKKIKWIELTNNYSTKFDKSRIDIEKINELYIEKDYSEYRCNQIEQQIKEVKSKLK